MEFYIPSTLASDFNTFLQTPICPSLGKIRNWGATPQVAETIKAEISNMDFKSKISNSDNAVVCRVSKTADLKKGDMLYDSTKGIYYLCTWNVFEEVNCKKTQLQICNTSITIKRYVPETVNDTTGIVITAASWSSIVTSMRCWISRTGYYDFETKNATPGTITNNKMVVNFQANSTTLGFKIGDEFDYFSNRHQVVDIEYNDLNVDGTSGLIILYAEKKVGGV